MREGMKELKMLILVTGLWFTTQVVSFRLNGNGHAYRSSRKCAALKAVPRSQGARAGESFKRTLHLVSVGAVALASQPLLAKAAVTEDQFINSLATIYTCKAIIKPIGGFVAAQAYDNARTNVKYLLNQLQIEKASNNLIKGALDFGNPDDLDNAQEGECVYCLAFASNVFPLTLNPQNPFLSYLIPSSVAGQLGNFLIQLDSTIYTVIFIPSDDSGGVPPAAEKYLKMLSGYLTNVDNAFDTLLKVGSPSQLAEAKKISDTQIKELPDAKFLFKKTTKKSSI